MQARTSTVPAGGGPVAAAMGLAALSTPVNGPSEVTASQVIAPSHPLAFLIDPNGLNLVTRALAVAPDTWRAQMLVKHYVRQKSHRLRSTHSTSFSVSTGRSKCCTTRRALRSS